MKKTTVLITGASGAVGYQALQELWRRTERYNIRLLALDRKYERKLFAPWQDKVNIIWGDLRNPDDASKAVAGAEVILHIAAIIPPLADEKPDLAWAVNLGGTFNLIKTARQLPQMPKFIFTSSISVYGDRLKNPWIQVGDPLNPSDGDEYARTKIAAERLLIQSGLPYTIFRLSGILTDKLKIQPLMFHMPLDTALEFCHCEDAGYALVEAIEHDEVWGKIYNLGGGPACRLSAREFIHRMFPLFGINPKVVPEYAFATRNFHSGYYADAHILNDLLGFQRHSIAEYIASVKRRVNPVQRALLRLIPSFVVRAWMLRMSEPYQSIRENNPSLIRRFYGSRAAFEQLLHHTLNQSTPNGIAEV